MNKIDQLFQNKESNILSIFFTAGFPQLNDTQLILKALNDNGADLVEIGMPFSDPLADGPVIQESSQIALRNGINLDIIFDQIREIKTGISIPIILMGYYNPVYQYGLDRFLGKCQDSGVSGLILPDLPFDEYKSMYEEKFHQAGIHYICLATPQTPAKRMKEISSVSKGFLYLVSTSSTTGGSNPLKEQEEYFKRVRGMDLRIPQLIGFGIRNRDDFSYACSHANGAIIGTAFIRELQKTEDEKPKYREKEIQRRIEEFIVQIR